MTKENFFKSITQYIFLFFLASFAGYVWEVLIFLIKDNSFCNRGFLYGPWLPIYGFGAVFFLLLLEKCKSHPIRVFFFSILIGSLLELVIGFFLDKVWQLRYWDYSGYPMNLDGYICLYSMLGFGIGGLLWVCFLSYHALMLWERVPIPIQHILLTILLLLLMTDWAAALIIPNVGDGVTF